MAVIERVVCDACERDLTTASIREAYRLSLEVEPIPAKAENAANISMRRQLAHTHHFCGLDCLDKWIAAEKVRRAEEARRFVRGDDIKAGRERREAEELESSCRNPNHSIWWDNGGGAW